MEENIPCIVRELQYSMDDGRVSGAVSLEDKMEGGAETGVGSIDNSTMWNMIGMCEIQVREYSWGNGSL